jgi:hypothetical protein
MLRGKTRNFIENLSVVTILLLLIAFGYNITLNDKNNQNTKQDTIVKVIKDDLNTTIPKDEYNDTTSVIFVAEKHDIDSKLKQKDSTTEQNSTTIKNIKNIKNKSKDKISKKDKRIKTVKKQTSSTVKKVTKKAKVTKKQKKYYINKFLKTTKYKIEKILNISKDENLTNSIKIRLTVLKNGKIKNPILTYGDDQEYFEEVKSTIMTLSPLRINKKITDQFPRYFRMTIKY